MNKYLKTYIRNRSVNLKDERVYEIDYFDPDLVSIPTLIFNCDVKDIRLIYEKLPEKFINFLNRDNLSTISNNDRKVDQIIHLVLSEKKIFKELTHVGIGNIVSSDPSLYMFGLLLKNVTETNYLMEVYNFRFFSIILGNMEVDISDNRNKDDFIIPSNYKIFFKKYLSFHEPEIMLGPDQLVLRTKRMKELIGQH